MSENKEYPDFLNLKPSNEVEEKNEIEYVLPSFSKRIMAMFLDALIFAFLALGFVASSQQICKAVPYFNEQEQKYDNIKLESGIFIRDSNENVRDLVTYYNSDTLSSASQKENALKEGIDKFFVFYSSKIGEEEGNAIKNEYESLVLDVSNTYSNVLDGNVYSLFVRDENGEIVKNSQITIPSATYYNFYASYLDNYAQGYFSSKIVEVIDLTRYFAFVIIAEIISSIALSSIITYYIIPLCFSRGKKTIGRLVFKIGLVNHRVFSVNAKQFTLRFLIIFFLEIMLSIFTLGIPLLFSFTMMIVTKGKQSFHDYLLKIYEVDLTDSIIYKCEDEIYKPASSDDIHNFKLK